MTHTTETHTHTTRKNKTARKKNKKKVRLLGTPELGWGKTEGGGLECKTWVLLLGGGITKKKKKKNEGGERRMVWCMGEPRGVVGGGGVWTRGAGDKKLGGGKQALFVVRAEDCLVMIDRPITQKTKSGVLGGDCVGAGLGGGGCGVGVWWGGGDKFEKRKLNLRNSDPIAQVSETTKSRLRVSRDMERTENSKDFAQGIGISQV